MLFIVSKDLPVKARERLQSFGDVLDFSTNGITYDTIADHPDIFLCIAGDKLIYAPNTPVGFLTKLKTKGINCIEGSTAVGKKYPASAHYNGTVSGNYFIHNLKISDPVLTDAVNRKKMIDVKQGYVRCSLLPLKEDHFITSDAGIKKVLEKKGIDSLFVEPNDIILPGVKHGFFGGACGVYQDIVFISGSLNYFSGGEAVINYLSNLNYTIVELHEGPLLDTGSILIIS